MSNFNKIRQENFRINNNPIRKDEGLRFVNLRAELDKHPIDLKVIFYKNNDRVEFEYNTSDPIFYGKVIRNLSKCEYATERFNFIDVYESRPNQSKTILIDIKNEIVTKDPSKTPMLLNEYFNFNKNTTTNKKDIYFNEVKISSNTNLIRFKAYKKQDSNDYCCFYIERSRYFTDMNHDTFVKRTSAIEFTKR